MHKEYYELRPYEQITAAEQIGTRANFRDILPYLAFSPSRALPEAVREIDLDFVTFELREAIGFSFHDSLGPEYGKAVYVSDCGNIQVDRDFTPGYDNEVIVEITARNYSDGTRDRYFCSSPHSHARSHTPLSFIDQIGLFLASTELLSSSIAIAASRSLVMMAFRSERTPFWAEQEAMQNVINWQNQVQEASHDYELWDEHSYHNELISMSKHLSHLYGLRYFACPLHKNVASLLSA